MDRRAFLRSLLGAGLVAAAPAPVIYCFAPPGGWALNHRVYTFKFKDVVGRLDSLDPFITQPLGPYTWYFCGPWKICTPLDSLRTMLSIERPPSSLTEGK